MLVLLDSSQLILRLRNLLFFASLELPGISQVLAFEIVRLLLLSELSIIDVFTFSVLLILI
jgi:hypothetical protein